MRILITDFYCASNRGDAAILEGMIASILKHFPNVNIRVMGDHPKAIKIINEVEAIPQPFTNIGFGIKRWKNFSLMGYYLCAAWFFSSLSIHFPKLSHPSVKAYLKADIVISKGGGCLSDVYRADVLGRLWGLYFSKLLRKPTFIYAQSIGPLEDHVNKWMASFVLNRLDFITVRDKRSEEILDEIGVCKEKIRVTADAAFNLPFDQIKSFSSIRYERLPEIEGVLPVSISVRQVAFYSDSNTHEQYVKALAALADWLIEVRGAKIYFASTCTGFAAYHNDDRLVAHEVIQCMKSKGTGNPVVVSGEYTAAELSHLYGQMALHVGTRMHSNILALLQGTPIVPIEYESKTSGLMELLGLGNLVIGIEGIEAETLKREVDQVLRNKNNIKYLIKQKLPRIKKKAEESAIEIKSYLYGYNMKIG